MRSLTTFCKPQLTKVLTGSLTAASLLLSACSARPHSVSSHSSDQLEPAESGGVSDTRPGDFRLGIVVIQKDDDLQNQNTDSVLGGNARYIVDPSSWLRSSFGAGSSLTTYPGFTRRLGTQEMGSIWNMCKGLIDTAIQNPEFGMLENGQRLQPGQTELFDQQTGILIIEIHASGQDYVLAVDSSHSESRALVDAVAELSWVNKVPNFASSSAQTTTRDMSP